jgi:hypothetical protein
MFAYTPHNYNTTSSKSQIDKIDYLFGNFEVSLYNFNSQYLIWTKSGKGFSKISVDKSLISENLKLSKENNFQVLNNILAFNRDDNVFRLLSINEYSGNIDVYCGSLEETTLVLKSVDLSYNLNTDKRNSICTKLMYKQLSKLQNELVIGYSFDNCKTWKPYLKALYRRK